MATPSCAPPPWTSGSRGLPTLARTDRAPRANPGKTLPPNQGGQHDFARAHAHPSLEDPGPRGRPPPRGARPGQSRHRSGRGGATGQLHRGQSRDPLGPGFLLDQGKFTTINHPDAVLETAPYGINNRGQIVGGYDTAGFAVHGFVLDRGRYTTIDVPGASRTIALRINARGQVLGDYEDARGGCHGYLLDKGRFTTIDVPGAPTQALGPQRPRPGRRRNLLHRPAERVPAAQGVYSPIDVPGAWQSTAVDINARGQTTGFYLDAARTTRVYLREANGSLSTIAFPGAVVTVPFGINNRGHVVGFYLDAYQVRHGFLFKNGAYTTIDHPLALSGQPGPRPQRPRPDRRPVRARRRPGGPGPRGRQSKQERPDPRGSHRVCPLTPHVVVDGIRSGERPVSGSQHHQVTWYLLAAS